LQSFGSRPRCKAVFQCFVSCSPGLVSHKMCAQVALVDLTVDSFEFATVVEFENWFGGPRVPDSAKSLDS
jgi:hypothetical protein